MTGLGECQDIAIIDAMGGMSSVPNVPSIRVLRGEHLINLPARFHKRIVRRPEHTPRVLVITDAAPLKLARHVIEDLLSGL
jgi:hypothetical protein